MAVKEECDRTIKECGYAVGISQRQYITKDMASSPTVPHEAMILSCTIDKKYSIYLVVTDVPGAYLNSDMESTIHMFLEGVNVEDTWYKQKGKPKLYMEHCNPPCCFGSFRPNHYRSGVPKLKNMTNVSQINPSIGSNLLM